MAKNKNPLGLFITDNGIAFFGGMIGDEHLVYGQENLSFGVIDNGYIKEPEHLLQQLKLIWKTHHIKPKYVRLVVQDQNVLVREFIIQKVDLKNKTIDEYFQDKLGKDFHVPFNKSILSHQIKKEDDKTFTVSLYIADENLLQDYYDVLEKLGVKDVIFDLAVSALMEIADKTENFYNENIMMVSLYDNQMSIQIVEKDQLVFGIIEECEGQKDDLYKKFEIICERVANYFQFNMRKGKEKITKTIVFNLNETIEYHDIINKMIPSIKDLNPKLFSIETYNDFFNSISKGIVVPYASNEIILYRKKDKKIIDFTLNRMNPLKTYGYYIFVLAIALFTLVSIIYIPYMANRKAVLEQEYINQALVVKRDDLKNSINDDLFTDRLINVYEDILLQQNHLPVNQYEDLTSVLPVNITMIDFSFNVQEKTMTIVIEASSTRAGLDYIIDIYERFGIQDNNDNDDAWITNQPIETILSEGMIEVVINYA